MTPNLRKVLLAGGTIWGIVMLVIGFFASFSIGANDTIMSLVDFFLIFVLPIVASTVAKWIPTASGVLLLASVVAVLTHVYVGDGMMDVIRTLGRVYLWFHMLFGISFVTFAKQIKSPNPE